MATEFKRKVMTNVPAGTITAAAQQLYQAGANTDTVVIGLLLTNTSGSSITADVLINTETGTSGPIGSLVNTDVYLIKGAQIPVGSALEIISGKVVLANTTSTATNGDVLCVRASVASSMDATFSLLENT